MTTEVAVMNKQGVALAADSAATVTMFDENRRREKVYFSENKLFALSKYEPVGIMIYQNAQFMGMPFEIIIKQYRKKLGKKKFATLEEYAKDFIDYMNTETKFFPEDVQDRFYELAALGFLRNMNREWKNEKKDEISKTISEYVKRAKLLKDLPNLSKGKVTEIIKKHDTIIRELIKETISKKLSETNIKRLVHRKVSL